MIQTSGHILLGIRLIVGAQLRMKDNHVLTLLAMRILCNPGLGVAQRNRAELFKTLGQLAGQRDFSVRPDGGIKIF